MAALKKPFLGEWIVVFYEESDPDGTPVMEADNAADLARETGMGVDVARSALTRMFPRSPEKKSHVEAAWILGRRCIAYFVSLRRDDIRCSKEETA